MVYVYEYTPGNRELLCYNMTHPLSIFQRVEVFSKVGCSRTETCDHCCASISSQGILQQPGDLGLTVGNVGGLSLRVSQGTYDIAKCKKTTVDVYRFCRTYEMKNYCIAEKLLREKTFANFVVLWLFAKVFSVKFRGMVSFGASKVSNPQKFSA